MLTSVLCLTGLLSFATIATCRDDLQDGRTYVRFARGDTVATTVTDVSVAVVETEPRICWPNASAESCFYQRCLGCHPQETMWPGKFVTCHPTNWVTAQWVHNLGHPPPSTDSRIPIEYQCLKMVATPDDKSFGNTVDIIRGCIPRAQVDSVCLALEAVERARGHSDARCYVCSRNDCNSAERITTLGHPLLFTLILLIFR